LEKLERTRFTGVSERHMIEGFGNKASLYRISARETWKEGSFSGDPKGYVGEGS